MINREMLAAYRIKREIERKEKKERRKQEGGGLKKKRIIKHMVLPALTLLYMAIQANPQVFATEDENFMMDFLRSLPNTTIVAYAAEVDEDEEEGYDYYKDFTMGIVDVGGKPSDYNYSVEVSKSTDWKGNEYSQGTNSDMTVYTSKYGYKRTTVKGLKNYPELRKNLIADYGKNMYGEDKWGENVFWSGGNMSMYTHTLSGKLSTMLHTTAGRKELSKYAKYVKGIESSYSAAPEAIIATFYGIVNDEEGLCTYKNTGTVSRVQFYTMFVKHKYGLTGSATDDFDDWKTKNENVLAPELYKFMGKGNKYAPWLGAAESNGNAFVQAKYDIFEGNKYSFSKKELYMPVTRLEVLHLICEDGGVSSGYSASACKKGLDKAFKDISTKNFYNHDKAQNKTMITSKKLTDDEARVMYAAYKAKILKPDSKGNSGIFGKATFPEVLKMLDAWTINCSK